MTRRKSTAEVPRLEGDRPVWIDENSRSIGATWSGGLRSTLRRDGRAAVGGFPGTMSEARAQVTTRLIPAARVSTSTASFTLSPEERESAARTVYSSARRDWLAHVDRDEDDDGDE
jgi:hypothetical protein